MGVINHVFFSYCGSMRVGYTARLLAIGYTNIYPVFFAQSFVEIRAALSPVGKLHRALLRSSAIISPESFHGALSNRSKLRAFASRTPARAFQRNGSRKMLGVAAGLAYPTQRTLLLQLIGLD